MQINVHTIFRIIVILLLFFPTVSLADDRRHDWEQYWNALIDMEAEDMAEGEDGTLNWEHHYDLLCELAARPIDINNATRENLEQLPFLSQRQVEDICEFLHLKNGMRSKGELMMIPSLDFYRRKLLECFIYIGDKRADDRFPSFDDLLGDSRHELTASLQIPFYERKGDKNDYLGYPYKHWLRYELLHSDRLRLGLIASQDAGEPLFTNGNNLGYDYYSFYLQLRRLGCIKNLVLGRYRASFGMGLVVNTNFSMGRQMMLATMGRPTDGFRPHSSRSEQGYFQGAAATISLGSGFTANAFASYRDIDATLNKADGSSSPTIATIITNGYHRTTTEMAKKGNANAMSGGANISYRDGVFSVGLTAMFTHLSHELRPKTENAAFRRFYPSGNDFLNLGVDYGYNLGTISLRGETAINRDGQLATIHKASFTIAGDVDLMFLHRYYSHRYTALYAQSFALGTRTSNEHGIYGALSWRLSRQWNVALYSDYAYFYWPRYQVSQSSWASDNMLTATFTPTDRWSFDARYRLKIRQKDKDGSDDNKTKTLTNDFTHRLRLSAAYHSPSGWSSRTRADLSLSARENTSDRGFLISQTIGYSQKRFKIDADLKYFHTDSYDARVYAYEPGLPHSFYFPPYYGHGIRYSLTARADISHSLRLTAKLGTTNYFDRPTIGSGLREINASSATDLEVMLRWRF